jgi:antitoxin component HigA of HigAB toxin-antitoxin module
MTTLAKSHGALGTDVYLELVKAFPLKVLRAPAEYEEAVKVLSRLLGRPDGKLSAGERDYTDVLGQLIDDWGGGRTAVIRKTHTPLENLKFLMSENAMTVSELGRVIGNRTAASLVLSGKRELSKAHIRRLAARFKVDGGLFL